jgi:hypothetical protein
MVSLPRVLRGVSVFVVAAALSACGGSYDTTKVKDYKLALVNDDAKLASDFKQLVADFNTYAGMDVLSYEDSAGDANSAIIVTPTLNCEPGKKVVGCGQWLSDTNEDNALLVRPGQRPHRTIRYSMRLEFDAEYMRTRSHLDKQKLFFHEVGHGLEMAHDDSSTRNVMHESVSGDKDFAAFFAKVRSYMQDQ